MTFFDLYTFSFAYVGTRATGNDGGNFVLAGPNWKGEKPAGVESVIRSETEFAMVGYRTQLFGPEDLDNVKEIQAAYKVQTLSEFLGKPAPPNAPEIEFMKPLTPQELRTSLKIFDNLNFLLQFCPTHNSEKELMARFAKLGIGGGRRFDPESFSPEIRQAIDAGMADGWRTYEEFKKSNVDTRKITSADLMGTREWLKNNYLYRMAGRDHRDLWRHERRSDVSNVHGRR